MHIAAKEGHDHTVECLVKKGANVRIEDTDGVSMCNSKTNGTLVRTMISTVKSTIRNVHIGGVHIHFLARYYVVAI